eukprot:GHVT01096737.1.p1 GENE.GHVT01096737.1~~GHVT01096737.1.p1  ORF type:complete len:497 (-),score=120.75 GHVT01096737.1:920-2410(-)
MAAAMKKSRLLRWRGGSRAVPLLAMILAAATASTAATARHSILITGGTVVTSTTMAKSDLLIIDGLVAAVGFDLPAPADARVVDASGKFVMPGGIDPHTHLAMPFMGTETVDDFSSGHDAAIAGGTTMHLDFVLPVEGSLLKGYHAWRAKAGKAKIDFGLHVAVTHFDAAVKEEMRQLVESFGVNSFKLFMAYKGSLMISDEGMLGAMAAAKQLGALVQVHAENGEAVAFGQAQVFDVLRISGPEGHALSRPSAVEAEATGRAIMLAELIGVPIYVVHVMSKAAAEVVARRRQQRQESRGPAVVGEVVLAGLALDESICWANDFTTAASAVMSPPIRKLATDGAALQEALVKNQLQLIGTDHATFTAKQKRAGLHDFRKIPNGVNGIQERLVVAWDLLVASGRLSPSKFIGLTSTAAAEIFNIFPQKGTIAVGSDADVIVFDGEASTSISAATHHSKSDVNVFEGRSVRGRVEMTIAMGEIVYEAGRVIAAEGRGR